MTNKLTLSIFIPAYNEEANIEHLLRSILSQKQDNFKLSDINVVSDGSSDKTEEIVLRVRKQNKKIKLIADGKRMGKPQRLNQIYQYNKSDILFIFDGDVLPYNNNLLNDVVSNFKDKTVAIVSCKKVAVYSKTFVGKLIYHWYQLTSEIGNEVGGGHNVYSFSMCAFALEKKFAKTIKYAKDAGPITKFTFFSALSKNLKFKFAKNTKIYFSLPDNTNDYLRQLNRYKKTKELNSDIFGKDTYKQIHKIPMSVKVSKIVNLTLKNPFFFPLSLVYRTCLIFMKRKNTTRGVSWEAVSSTKQITI